MFKKFFRNIQTLFPCLHDLRFRFKLARMRFTGKPHEADFEALRLFNLPENALLLDIGSNRGEAIQSMKVCMSGSHSIVGFEPNALLAKKTQAYFGTTATVHNCGLGRVPASAELHIPVYRQWSFDGLASFDYSEAADWLPSRMWNFNPKKLSIRSFPCEIKTLDSFKLAPSFIKIDVQGFEFEVLQGARQTLTQYRPTLLIETADDASAEFLENLGYVFYAYKNGQLLQKRPELNAFAVFKG